MNAEITYWCNYWQMYKNLGEIVAYEKRLWFKLVVPKKTFFPCRFFCLIAGNSFFQSSVFLYLTEVVAAIHSSMDTVFSEDHLQPWIAYVQCIWQIFPFKDIVNSKEHLQPYIWMVLSVSISGGHLQWSSIFKGTALLWSKHLQSFLFSKILS